MNLELEGIHRNMINNGDQVWSIGELTTYIRELFEIDFRLQDITVQGEISNYSRARSGHLYFTLKDARAQLRCVMWRSSAMSLNFDPQDGDEVQARGHISVYETNGVYQLYAETLHRAGRGQLALAFEELKERLAAEGLFDQENKQPIATFPRRIGIVTSADAAALRDILNVLNRRWPLVSVLVAPTLVQGKDAPPQILHALQWLDGRSDIDTIIVARGGGSLEDLWAFNDESVARGIFAAEHPIITGIGHETDFTIADFVADVRAPTPSAAAELAVPDQNEVRSYIQGLRQVLTNKARLDFDQKRLQINGLGRTLNQMSPKTRLDGNRQHLDWLVTSLDKATYRKLENARARLELLEAGLGAYSPMATISRGFAIVRGHDGEIIRSTSQVTEGDEISIQVSDGVLDAEVR